MDVRVIPSFCANDIGLIAAHRKEIQIGDAARRTLETAAGERRKIKVLADGMESSRQAAAQMSKDRANGGPVSIRIHVTAR